MVIKSVRMYSACVWKWPPSGVILNQKREINLPARKVYLLTSFAWGLLFWMMATVFMVYQVEVVRLDALQLVLVGTALELGAFLFEVPTGMVADTWSRRWSVITGYLVTGVSFLAMGFFPSFTALVVASFAWCAPEINVQPMPQAKEATTSAVNDGKKPMARNDTPVTR